MVMRYIQENKDMLVLKELKELIKEKKSKKEIDEFIEKNLYKKNII